MSFQGYFKVIQRQNWKAEESLIKKVRKDYVKFGSVMS